jgi:FkbM family methyltransferase
MSAQNLYQDWTLPPASERDVKEITDGDYNLPLTFEPQNVLDIGAHVGLFAGWARHTWPGCKVTSYEPWQENCDYFKKNLSNDTNVTLIEEACFPSESVEIHEGLNSFTNTIFPKELGYTKPNSERTIKASIPQGKFDFIKLDCEGAEADILPNLDLSETRAIVVECHNEKLAFRVDKYLKSLGFERLMKKYHGYMDVQLLKFARPGSSNPIPQKLMVCIPVYGDVCGHTSQCLMRLIQNPPVAFMLNYCLGDSLVSRARNTLTNQFMRSDATDLLFIDSDLIFSPEQILRIVNHPDDVVGGLYPKKQDKESVEWVLNTHKELPEKRADGCQQVAYIGTGFIRVKRHVFEAMIEHYGDEITYKDDCSESIMHDLWPVGTYRYEDGSRRYLSEDWFFCQRWMDMGGKIWADTKVVLKHVGTAIFPLKCQEKKLMEDMPKE